MFRRFRYGFDRCDKGVYTRCADESADYESRDGCFGQHDGFEWTHTRRSSSSRVKGLLYAVATLAFVSLFVLPRFSFAANAPTYNEMGVVWGPNSVGPNSQNQAQSGVVVITNSNLNAALLTLGYSVLDSRLDHDAKAKLSNESTGGAFYTFAQLFYRFYSNGQYNYPSWGGGVPGTSGSMMWGAFDTWSAIYGDDYIYWGAYTARQAAAAKEDLEAILDGGSVGGGGSGGGSGSGGPSTDGTYTYFDFDNYNASNASGFYSNNDIKGVCFSSSWMSVYEQRVSSIESMGLEPALTIIAGADGVRLTPGLSIWLFGLGNNVPTFSLGDAFVYVTGTQIYTAYCYNSNTSSVVTHDGKNYVYLDQPNLSGFGTYSWSNSMDAIRPWYATYGVPVGSGGGGSGGGGTPSVPETNWPDDPDPDYGTPPELPEPQNPIPDVEPGDPANPVTPSPPVEPGNPTSPIVPSPPQEPGNPQNPTVPTPPTLPNPTTYTGGTYTIDIQGILDAMDEHCIHLQNCITSNFSGYWSSISTLISNEFTNLKTYMQTLTESVNGMIEWLAEVIDGEFSYQNTYMNSLATAITNKLGWLGNMLHADLGYQNTYLQQVASSINDNIQWLGELVADYFESLADYLHDLFEWLAEQFDFSVSGGSYNDDTVVSWLKKIWSKLGSGTRSRPADPVSDPVGTGGWLDTLFNNLVTALTDLFPGLLEELLGGLGELTSKFPFSIPWDVAALLGLLVAPAECPSVEIPAYTYDGTSIVQAGSYEIDLEQYDEVWGGVRMMMKVAFVMYVLVHTKDFMAVIEKVVSPGA